MHDSRHDRAPLGDWYIHDGAVGLRRSGTWMIAGGAMLAGLGICVLLMAATTWSGYVPQASLTVLGGVAVAGFGWAQLREADRQRPRLVTVPVGVTPLAHPRPTRPRPPDGRRPMTVMAWVETPALPPSRR